MLDGPDRSGIMVDRHRQAAHGMAGWGYGITRREFVRRAAGTVALAGLGGALSACSNEGSGSQGGDVEIEYWHINTETFGLGAVRDLARRFNEENPGIRVRESFHGSEAYASLLEDLQTAQAAGRSPDVAQIGYDQQGYVGSNFRFAPVEELAAEYGGEDFFGGFQESLLDLARVDGRQAGVPYALSTAIVYCNADLLSEAGSDPGNLPQDWAGWEEVLVTVRRELDIPGLAFDVSPGITWHPQYMIECNGGRVLGCEGGQAVAAFDSPEAVEATRFWADMVDRGLVLNVLGEQAEQAFLGGELAAYIDSSSTTTAFEEQASFELTGTHYPRFGDKELRLPGGGNSLFVFSEEDAKREAAWRFVRFLAGTEGQRTWIEATGYLPTRADLEAPGDSRLSEVADGQIRYTVPWVSFPGSNGFQASRMFFDAHQTAIGGQADPEQALSGAAEEVNGLIEGEPCP